MDRFIVKKRSVLIFPNGTLKSNMDRFIVKKRSVLIFPNGTLKSNMDRFIVSQIRWYYIQTRSFKIQYG